LKRPRSLSPSRLTFAEDEEVEDEDEETGEEEEGE